MDRVLPVDAVQRIRDRRPQAGNVARGKRRLARDALEARALDPLDHEVGIGGESPAPPKRGTCAPASAGRIRLSVWKPSSALPPSPAAMRGTLMIAGNPSAFAGADPGHAENARHRARVDHLAQREAVDLPRRFGGVGRLRVHLRCALLTSPHADLRRRCRVDVRRVCADLPGIRLYGLFRARHAHRRRGARASLGYGWFWTFLFCIAALFGVLSWLIKAGKLGNSE